MFGFRIHKSSLLLTIIFTLAASVIFFLMGLTYKHLDKVSTNNYWVDHSMQISLKLEKLYADLKDIETERRNFILVDSEKPKKVVAERVKEINQLTAEIEYLVQDNPEQIENISDLKNLISEKLHIVKESFAYHFETNNPEDLNKSLLAGENVMSRINDKVKEMLAKEEVLLHKRQSDYLLSQKFTPVYFYIISLFSLALLGFAFYRINREVTIQKKANRDLQFALETADIAEKVGEYGIWSYRSATDSFTYSDNLYRLFGIQPQDYSMLNFMEQHIVPADQEIVRRKFNLLKNGFSLDPFTYTILREDGEQRTFRVFAQVTVDNQGERMVIGTTSDVTEEMRSEANLERANQALIFYNESSKEAEIIGRYGFWRWMLDTQTFLFSDNLFKIFGYDPETTEHRLDTFIPNVHPEDFDMVMQVIDKMKNGDVSVPTFRHRIIRQNDGALRYIQISNKLIKDEKQGDYFLIITQDVTEEVISQKYIEEKNRVLEAKNKELTAFNYVASHDLQEPLRKIETFLSRLRDKDLERLSEAGKQYLTKTESSAGRMRKLINDLLQFSRTTRIEQVFEITDLNAMMDNALDDLHTPIDETGTTVKYEHLPTLKVIPFQVQQLFSNLISNSVKYRKENTAPVITITSQKVKSDAYPFLSNNYKWYFKFTFKDNGIGFENKYAEQIFELFNRLHGKTEYEGTGIGLAICQKIIENHRGYIYAEAELGKGSSFYVFLPYED